MLALVNSNYFEGLEGLSVIYDEKLRRISVG